MGIDMLPIANTAGAASWNAFSTNMGIGIEFMFCAVYSIYKYTHLSTIQKQITCQISHQWQGLIALKTDNNVELSQNLELWIWWEITVILWQYLFYNTSVLQWRLVLCIHAISAKNVD